MEKHQILAVADELFNLRMVLYNISFLYIGMLFAKNLTAAKILLITIAFVSARLGALIMNRYMGREIDLENKKKAWMQSLKIQKSTLLASFLFLSVVFIASAYMLNTLSFVLAPPVLIMFVLDPTLKSKTSNRHFSVGIMQSFSVIAGYVGATGAFPQTITLYLLAGAIILIGTGNDIMYTIMHHDFDKRHGLKTYPVKYGIKKALFLARVLHAVAALLIIAFALSTRSYIIGIGALIAAVILSLEHSGLREGKDRDIVSRGMTYNPALAFVLFISVLIATLMTL